MPDEVPAVDSCQPASKRHRATSEEALLPSAPSHTEDTPVQGQYEASHQPQAHEAEPEKQFQQQQQLQPAVAWQPKGVQQMFEHEVLESILRSIKQLGLLYSDKHDMQELSQHHLAQLRTQPLLTQLRMLSVHATQYNPERSAEDLFQERFSSLEQSHKSTLWLNNRYGSPSKRRLSHEAESLIKQLTARRLLLPKAVPELAAQVLPANLQPAYVLCLGGYTGNRPLPDFAAHVLLAVAVKIFHALQQCPTAVKQQQEAKESLQLAYTLRQQAVQPSTDPAAKSLAAHQASLPDHSSVMETLTDPATRTQKTQNQDPTDPRLTAQPKASPASTGALDLQAVFATVEAALVAMHWLDEDSLDEACLGDVQTKPALDQLLIWSRFCGQVDKDKQSSNASAFLTILTNAHEKRQSRVPKGTDGMGKPNARRGQVGKQCYRLLLDAKQAGLMQGNMCSCTNVYTHLQTE